MKKIEDLKVGDFIAFYYDYHKGVIPPTDGDLENTSIEVSNITHVRDDGMIVHFMYGHHSIAECVKREHILAIGNMDGETKLKGWGGKFDLI